MNFFRDDTGILGFICFIIYQGELLMIELNDELTDDMLDESHPAYWLVERAYRRGFNQALVEIVNYAENVPPEFRAWVARYLERCKVWRHNNIPRKLPPPIPPYRKEILHEMEYTQPCPLCQSYGHPIKRSEGWHVRCTGCSRKTPYFKRKSAALNSWNKNFKAAESAAATN
jgi:hypothetical protein